MFKIRNIFIALGILLFLGSCVSSGPKGMRKKRKKKNCGCPSFGQLSIPAQQTYYLQA